MESVIYMANNYENKVTTKEVAPYYVADWHTKSGSFTWRLIAAICPAGQVLTSRLH